MWALVKVACTNRRPDLEYGAASCHVPMDLVSELQISAYGDAVFYMNNRKLYLGRLVPSTVPSVCTASSVSLDGSVQVYVPLPLDSERLGTIIAPATRHEVAESIVARVITRDTAQSHHNDTTPQSRTLGSAEQTRVARARALRSEVSALLAPLYVTPGCIVVNNTGSGSVSRIEIISAKSTGKALVDAWANHRNISSASPTRISQVPIYTVSPRTRIRPYRTTHGVRPGESTGTGTDEKNDQSVPKPSVVKRSLLERVGGMSNAIQSLREVILYPTQYAEMYKDMNVDGIGGVLLSGPPGVGKTMLLKSVCAEFGAALVSVDGPSIYSSFFGESESNLRSIFDRAQKSAAEKCTVLFIDELDAMCPNRETSSNEERRVVATMLTLLDGLKGRGGQLVIIGATNRPNNIDPALRRPGRMDREVHVGVPTTIERRDILRVHTRTLPLCTDKDTGVDLDQLAVVTRGYVGADIAALCREAAFSALRKQAIAANEEIGIAAGAAVVQSDDFDIALSRVSPSTARESVIVGLETKSWDSIGGVDDIKHRMQELIEWPIRYGASYRKLGLTPTRGVLLYGPPGCSKTSLAKAVAGSSHCSFLALSGAQVYSSLLGEAERTIRETFRRARENAPAVLFLDEIDSLVGNRETGSGDSVSNRILSTLLNELDGLEDTGHVVCIAATNRPEMIDAALLRPGRLGNLIYVPPPSEAARVEILRIHTRDMQLSADVSLAHLAVLTPGFTGADIEGLCREAALTALRENIDATQVTLPHFLDVLPLFSGNLQDTAMYEAFAG